jgi:ubiquinone/menaquinone biosynthesis C-methylase UbiE
MQTVDFEKFKLNKDDRILDLGCGEGRHAITAYMLAHVHAVAVDLSFSDLKITQERFEDFKSNDDEKDLSIIQANGMILPFADNTFDKVICSEVLEHIPDYQAVLKEIKRVLKPDGYFAASVPRFFPEWVCWALSDEYHANEGGHIRIFKEKALKKDIVSQGFSFKGKHWAHALHSPYWWLKCMFWGNDDAAPVKLYHRLLVWDLMEKPRTTRLLDKMLNPFIGKSLVMYFNNES